MVARVASNHVYTSPVVLDKTDPSESKKGREKKKTSLRLGGLQREEDDIITLGWSHSQPLRIRRIRKPDPW